MLNLKVARVKKQYTQTDLAVKIGVSLTTVSSWEIGRGKPSMDNLIKLSNILEISIDELVKK
jgi:transcriptional regulator with XRE-family HTH domain